VAVLEFVSDKVIFPLVLHMVPEDCRARRSLDIFEPKSRAVRTRSLPVRMSRSAPLRRPWCRLGADGCSEASCSAGFHSCQPPNPQAGVEIAHAKAP